MDDFFVDKYVHANVCRNDDLKKMNCEYCKFILVEAGSGVIRINGKNYSFSAPSAICLNDEDKADMVSSLGLSCDIIYFLPETLNSSFSTDVMKDGTKLKDLGRTTYQDAILLQPFYQVDKDVASPYVILLPFEYAFSIKNHISSIEKQIVEKPNGFWPCRSRSYLMEILFILQALTDDETSVVEGISDFKESNNLLNNVICYLNEHLGDKILLSDLTKQFMTNRNKLNSMFKAETNLTVMQFLLKMRMEFAALLLINTGLPVYEIGARVGFTDAGYFSSSFKGFYGVNPNEYRNQV